MKDFLKYIVMDPKVNNRINEWKYLIMDPKANPNEREYLIMDPKAKPNEWKKPNNGFES